MPPFVSGPIIKIVSGTITIIQIKGTKRAFIIGPLTNGGAEAVAVGFNLLMEKAPVSYTHLSNL